MKQSTITGKITLTALFAAIICVATVTIRIPIQATGGYIHLGDAFVILAGVFLGSGYGALAAGIGAMLADIMGGYFIYAPVTFVIKALMAVSVWLVSVKLYERGISDSKSQELSTPVKPHENIRFFFGGVFAAIINVSGYFIFEWILYGTAAILGIPGNLVQGISGLVISVLLYPVIKKAYHAVAAR